MIKNKHKKIVLYFSLLLSLVLTVVPIYTFANDFANRNNISVVDEVKYNDLIVGKSYKVVGVLMDKKTQKEFSEKVTREFKPDKKDGSIEINFILPKDNISENTDLVAYEEIYLGDQLVAEHKDINDQDQTVKITHENPTTPKLPDTGVGYFKKPKTILMITLLFSGISLLLITIYLSRKKYER